MTRSPVRARRRIVAVGLLALVGSLAAGCEQRYEQRRLDRIVRQAQANRATGAVDIEQAARAGTFAWSDFVDRAFDELEAASTDPARIPAALALAGAVLDAGLVLERTAVPQPGAEHPLGGLGPEFEIKWLRVGRLAYLAAEQASIAGRLADARSLVLSGPVRWQNEHYWRRYPDHDALAAIILAQSGERALAIQRLRSRPDLAPPADEVLAQLLRPGN